MKEELMLSLREVADEPEVVCRREARLDVSAAWGAIGSVRASAAWGGKKLGEPRIWKCSTLRVSLPTWGDSTTGMQK